jgi:hypothetical protein
VGLTICGVVVGLLGSIYGEARINLWGGWFVDRINLWGHFVRAVGGEAQRQFAQWQREGAQQSVRSVGGEAHKQSAHWLRGGPQQYVGWIASSWMALQGLLSWEQVLFRTQEKMCAPKHTEQVSLAQKRREAG